MDFGSFGESNLLSNESSGNGGGAGGALGISANNLLKSLGGRSLIADTDYGKCHDDENQQQTSRDMKIPFELRGGGSNTTTSNHRNNAAAGADYMSPWAVHALLQHQTYSPFRNPSGVHMPLSMIGRDGGMHGGAAVQLGRGGCCFTALQWQELEHQALIFKYILAQEPVPPELIMPIKRSLGASNDFASHHHQPNLGWGAFQMRFANVKADAEPGRCRRTDGKKWRCSRDAAPDQKYCERHMHRGRPRSRKPVEGGQTAINASSNNNNNNNTNATTNPSAGVGGGGASQPLNVGGHGPLSPHGASFSSLSALGRSSSLRPSSITTTPSISVTDSHNNNNNNNTDQFLNLKSLYGSSAMSMSTGNNNNNNSNNNGVSHFKTPLNMVSSASAASACKDYRYMNWMKGEGEDNHNNQMLASEKTDNTTSMMIPNNNNSNNWRWSPSTKLNINNPTTTSTTSSILQYTSSPQMRSLMGTHDLSFDSLNQQSHFLSETQQPLRHFIDDWGAASDEHHHHNHQNQNQNQRSSQLSMTSLPMASTDLGLGLMMNNQEPSHHHSRSYIPVALGGPLAEALQHSGNNHNTTTSKNGKSGALNLLSNEGWDFGSPHQSPRMASPTGVLQKTLASLSDSSSGSSAVVAKHDTLHHNLSNV